MPSASGIRRRSTPVGTCRSRPPQAGQPLQSRLSLSCLNLRCRSANPAAPASNGFERGARLSGAAVLMPPAKPWSREPNRDLWPGKTVPSHAGDDGDLTRKATRFDVCRLDQHARLPRGSGRRGAQCQPRGAVARKRGRQRPHAEKEAGEPPAPDTELVHPKCQAGDENQDDRELRAHVRRRETFGRHEPGPSAPRHRDPG